MRCISFMSLLGCLMTLACDAEDACDSGQRYEQGVCVTPMKAVVAVDAGCTEVLEDEIGATCVDDAECSCAAPFCAVQPGQTEGYCTILGCKEPGGSCPAGYSCLDLSAFGVDPFCAPE
jgi:hypothetical protein